MADNIVHSTTDCSKKTKTQNGQHKNHYTTVKMAPCRVCGGTSTGYHFGVVSCEACKAFFRRAISKVSYGQGGCQKGNDCANTPRKIKSCYTCRFKRCLEAGMSKGGARRGRYSIELRTKSILDAQRVEHEKAISDENGKRLKPDQPQPLAQNTQDNSDTHIPQLIIKEFPWKQKSDLFKFENDTLSDSPHESDIHLTNQDYSLMKAIFEGYTFCKSNDCFSKEDISEFIQSSTDDSSIDPAENCSNHRSDCLDLLADSMSDLTSTDQTNVTAKDGDFCSIPSLLRSEEEQLLDRTIEALVILQGALYPHHKVTEVILQKQKIIEDQHKQREEAFLCMFGSTEYASPDEFKEVLSEVNIELDDRLVRFREKAHAMEASIVQYVYHSKFIPGFKQLDSNDVSDVLKASFSEFWLLSNFATLNEEKGVSGGTDVVINGHKKVIKTFFPKEYVDDVFMFAYSLQKLELTVEEVSIIRAIVLTFTDRCSLQEPEKIDKLNQLFIRCLQYNLSKTARNPSCRFYKIFDRLIAVRTLMHRNKQVNEQFLKEWGFLMADFPLWREMMLSQLPHLQKRGNQYFSVFAP